MLYREWLRFLLQTTSCYEIKEKGESPWRNGISQYLLLFYPSEHLGKYAALRSRVITVVLVVISVVWIPILQSSNSGQLYIYIQSITSYLAPPVTAVFLLAVFWKRANEQGAFWGLMLGLAVGLSRMALELAHPTPHCGILDRRPSLVKDIHYLHFAVFLCLLTAAVVVGISLLTDPPSESQVKNMTWWTLQPEQSPKASKAFRPNGFSRDEDNGPAESHPTSSGCNGATNSPSCVEPVEATEKTHTERGTEESPFWAQICCTNALILICINVFFYAYFA